MLDEDLATVGPSSAAGLVRATRERPVQTINRVEDLDEDTLLALLQLESERRSIAFWVAVASGVGSFGLGAVVRMLPPLSPVVDGALFILQTAVAVVMMGSAAVAAVTLATALPREARTLGISLRVALRVHFKLMSVKGQMPKLNAPGRMDAYRRSVVRELMASFPKVTDKPKP